MEYCTDIEELVGKVFKQINVGEETIVFHCTSGEAYKMYHIQSCCESVYVEDINGDIEDLINSPILSAYESSNNAESDWGSKTWTFYHIATNKGSITIRWLGESNGYYSEAVDLVRIK